MTSDEAANIILNKAGVRIGAEMSKHVARQLSRPGAGAKPIRVMGGDARTGAPVLLEIDPAALMASRAHEQLNLFSA